MNRSLQKNLAQIAREHLRIESLETRRSDGLDFHDVSVWRVKAALHAAYDLGRNASRKAKGGDE